MPAPGHLRLPDANACPVPPRRRVTAPLSAAMALAPAARIPTPTTTVRPVVLNHAARRREPERRAPPPPQTPPSTRPPAPAVLAPRCTTVVHLRPMHCTGIHSWRLGRSQRRDFHRTDPELRVDMPPSNGGRTLPMALVRDALDRLRGFLTLAAYRRSSLSESQQAPWSRPLSTTDAVRSPYIRIRPAFARLPRRTRPDAWQPSKTSTYEFRQYRRMKS